MATVHSEFFGPIPTIEREISHEEAEALAGRPLKFGNRWAIAKGRVLRRLELRELCRDCLGGGCRECRGQGAICVEFWFREED